jgi:hypothetical protein
VLRQATELAAGNLRLVIHDCQLEPNNLWLNARTVLAVTRLPVGRTFLSVQELEPINWSKFVLGTPSALMKPTPDKRGLAQISVLADEL